MTGTYSLQKVNEGFIDLMWTLYGFCQVVEYLKNKSWGSSRWCTVYNQCIDLTGTTIVLMINAYGLCKVYGGFIDLTWTLYRLGQVVEHLKNMSCGLSGRCTVCGQVIIMVVWLLC